MVRELSSKSTVENISLGTKLIKEFQITRRETNVSFSTPSARNTAGILYPVQPIHKSSPSSPKDKVFFEETVVGSL
jgi:hypothetical protein